MSAGLCRCSSYRRRFDINRKRQMGSGYPGMDRAAASLVSGRWRRGTGKSPGADCLMRDIVPEIERRMQADFPDRLQEWRAENELAKIREEQWKREVRAALKAGNAPPDPPATPGPEPQAPRLRQNDVTIERVASLLQSAAPKGLLLVRDELAGWICGMCSYNDSGRAFYVEAFGGRSYRVERQKNPEPIIVPRLVVAVFGG